MRFFRKISHRTTPQEITPRRILIADDDETITNLIKTTLNDPRYEIVAVKDGLGAIEAFEAAEFDVVILDIMMPYVDGLQACQHIRDRSDVPIIILTARGGTEDVVHGFELGADDYITKPFKTAELIARVESILRRVEGYKNRRAPPVIKLHDIEVDEPRHRVVVRGTETSLTPMEFELLYFLAANPGQVFDRETLYREVWGYDYVGETNLVDVCVRRLREKVEIEPSRPTIILTVRGVGYKFTDQ
ncbi:MAG: response regulator transcription factor [Chloroflexaceae bacterium]|nr:response regulator transcription factor [Chloroflexaceae bacterium]